MVSHPSQFGLRENGKGFSPYIGKWRLAGNRVIAIKFEYLSGLVEIAIVLQTVLIDTLLGHASRFIKELSNPIDKTIDQVVVQALVPLMDKA